MLQRAHYLQQGHEVASWEILHRKVQVVPVLKRAVQLDQPRRLRHSKKIALAAHVHDLVPPTHFILVQDLQHAHQPHLSRFFANESPQHHLESNKITVFQVTA